MTTDALIGRMLIDLTIVLAVVWVLANLLVRLRQPPILAAIIGGVVLGPTALGALPGDPSAALFPADVRGLLAAVGSIGVVLFMFLVGSELDLGAVRRSHRAVAGVSIGSIVVPLAVGLGLAALVYDSHRTVGVTRSALCRLRCS